MAPLLNSERTPDLAEALQVLKEQVRESLREAAQAREKYLLRCEVAALPMDIFTWLNGQELPQKFYWADRDGRYQIAGAGVAHRIKGDTPPAPKTIFATCRQHLNPDFPDMKYFGGFCFDPRNTGEEWAEFGAYSFWVPLLEMTLTAEGVRLACNFMPDTDWRDIEPIFKKTNFQREAPKNDISLPRNCRNTPEKESWIGSLQEILNDIRAGNIRKTVLARRSCFTLDESLAPVDLLRSLTTATPNCFHFYFQPEGGNAFLGASPERLYKRSGDLLETEALAGTRPRGRTSEEDQAYREELMNSKKDFQEHALVGEAIGTNLKDHCAKLEQDPEVSLLKLRGGQHLLSRFRGQLKAGVTDADLIACLHPTPAVAGLPTAEALARIREIEPFARGWYAGPVGCVGIDETEFAVAIRSGLLTSRQLCLYAGAGIVADSSPEDEWEEVENKMNTFLTGLSDELD